MQDKQDQIFQETNEEMALLSNSNDEEDLKRTVEKKVPPGQWYGATVYIKGRKKNTCMKEYSKLIEKL